MIKVDLTKAVLEQKIEKYAENVRKIATKMEKLETEGFEFLGWKDLPKNYDINELEDIKNEVKKLLKAKIDTLVVVGIGGSFAGAKAAIEMIQGEYKLDAKMEIVWVGESLSSTNLAQKLQYVKNRNFAINVISKSGTTLEPAIAFRLFRRLLEEKVGVYNASKFIFATTDANKGALLKIAKENDYKKFVIPDNIGGRFSVLTAVGLFPMACAGIDISVVMKGAKRGWKNYSSVILAQNDAYRYAVARDILSKSFAIEVMVQYEPQMRYFNEWWKQLAGESEGKSHRGLYPSSLIFSTDLHSLGQFIQDGSKILFETVLTVQIPSMDVELIESENNADNLNYISDKTLSEINDVAFSATLDAHVNVGKVPCIHIEFEKMDEENFGELVIFFERAVAMTAYLAGVNPFNQPGVEVYKQNMLRILDSKAKDGK